MEKVGVKVSLRGPHLHPDLVVCVALVGDPVGDGVDDVDLEEVCRRGVGVVQGLLLGGQPLGGVLARHGAHARGRASSGGDGVDAYQGVADGAVVGGVVQHGGGEHPALLAGDTKKLSGKSAAFACLSGAWRDGLDGVGATGRGGKEKSQNLKLPGREML